MPPNATTAFVLSTNYAHLPPKYRRKKFIVLQEHGSDASTSPIPDKENRVDRRGVQSSVIAYVSPAQAPITRMPGRLSLSLEKRRVTRQEAQRRAGAARASLSTFAHDEFPFVEGGPFHGTQNGKEDHTDGEEHLDEKQSPTAQEQSPAFVYEDPADVPVSSQRRRVVSSEAASHMEATGEDTFVGSKKRKLEEVVEETGRELDAPPVKVRRSARVRRIPTRYDP